MVYSRMKRASKQKQFSHPTVNSSFQVHVDTLGMTNSRSKSLLWKSFGQKVLSTRKNIVPIQMYARFPLLMIYNGDVHDWYKASKSNHSRWVEIRHMVNLILHSKFQHASETLRLLIRLYALVEKQVARMNYPRWTSISQENLERFIICWAKTDQNYLRHGLTILIFIGNLRQKFQSFGIVKISIYELFVSCHFS